MRAEFHDSRILHKTPFYLHVAWHGIFSLRTSASSAGRLGVVLALVALRSTVAVIQADSALVSAILVSSAAASVELQALPGLEVSAQARPLLVRLKPSARHVRSVHLKACLLCCPLLATRGGRRTGIHRGW